MTLTRTRFQRLLRIAAAIGILTVIAAYAAWRSFAYASGPKIYIFEPTDGTSVASSTVQVIGQALHISRLSINGYPTSVDEKGDFKEILAVFPGVNRITLSASDQFGRSVEARVSIYGALRP